MVPERGNGTLGYREAVPSPLEFLLRNSEAQCQSCSSTPGPSKGPAPSSFPAWHQKPGAWEGFQDSTSCIYISQKPILNNQRISCNGHRMINGLPSLISKSTRIKRLFFILTRPLTKWITVGQWVRCSGFPLMHLLSENNIACLVCFTRLM